MTSTTRLKCAFVCCIVIAFVGISIGTLSFFPLHKSSVETEAPLLQNHSKANDRRYDRLVWVVIDALRADMVYGPESISSLSSKDHLNKYMPYTNQLLQMKSAQAYVGLASLPTVTMPRLKALTTGRLPKFIDVMKNFNSAQLVSDNLISSFAQSGFKLTFYGDETWLKLFPNLFSTIDTTSGFFAKDTVQVDRNVSRHLPQDLDPKMKHPKSRDWDVLILHYLGLDHVGHSKGPRSGLMREKLGEMDGIIKFIQSSIQEQDKIRQDEDPNARSTLFVLCSDHGMTEMGNHGGSSMEESSSVLMFPSIPLIHERNQYSSRHQMDLVPTIALLFGLHLPSENTGRALEDVLDYSCHKSKRCLVDALNTNVRQLWALAQKKKIPLQSMEITFNQLDQIYAEMSTSKELSLADPFISKAIQLMQELQNQLTVLDDAQYNITWLSSGLLCCFLSLGILALITFRLHKWLHGKMICSMTDKLMLGFAALHVASLGSSSSIENEHATCSFILSSVLVILTLRWLVNRPRKRNKVQLVALCWMLISTRILRSRNQVINFARLNHLNSNLDLTISVTTTFTLLDMSPEYIVTAIWFMGILTIWYFYRRLIVSVVPLLFTTGMICCIWHHLLENNDPRLNTVVDINNVAHGAYACVLGLWMISYRKWSDSPVHWELAIWLLMTLLHRTSNLCTLLLIMTQVFSLRLYCVSVVQLRGPRMLQFSQLIGWVGHCAFFAFGNSHVVATIDISKAYTGLTAYHQSIVGLLTFLITYSGYIVTWISSLQMIAYCGDHCPKYKRFGPIYFATIVSGLQLFHLVVYMVIVYSMRFHLFIWSVFAPKLLYLISITVVILLNACVMIGL